jgi:hypothetical protein
VLVLAALACDDPVSDGRTRVEATPIDSGRAQATTLDGTDWDADVPDRHESEGADDSAASCAVDTDGAAMAEDVDHMEDGDVFLETAPDLATTSDADASDSDGDPGDPPMPSEVTASTCAQLAGEHPGGTVIGLGGSGDSICELSVPDAFIETHNTFGGSTGPFFEWNDEACVIKRRWLGVGAVGQQWLMQKGDGVSPKCELISVGPSACGAGWTLVPAFDGAGQARIQRWQHASPNTATLTYDVALGSVGAVMIVGVTGATTHLLAVNASATGGVSAFLLDADSQGVLSSSADTPLPGKAWSQKLAANKTATGTVACRASGGGAWVATFDPGSTVYVSRIGSLGLEAQRSAPLPQGTMPGAIAEHGDQLALLVGAIYGAPILMVWGADGAMRWQSAVVGVSKSSYNLLVSTAYYLRPAAGGAFWVAGSAFFGKGSIALVQGGDVVHVAPPVKWASAATMGGWHDRLVVAWVESYFDQLHVTRVFDAFGNPSCAASGPCWAKNIGDCDDKNPCTFDRCDAAHGGCWNPALSDGAWCGPGSVCVNGACAKAP